MLVTKKVSSGLVVTKKISKSIEIEEDLAKSLNFNFNYLKQKIPNMTMMEFEIFTPALKQLENCNNGCSFVCLQNIGSKDQTDISNISNTLFEVNNYRTYDVLKKKFFEKYILPEKKILFKQVSDKVVVLNEFFNEIKILKIDLENHKLKVQKYQKEIDKNIKELLTQYDLLNLIIDEAVKRGIKTQEEIENDNIISRIISMKNTQIVANQLKETLKIFLINIESEINICDEYLTNMHSSLLTLKLNNINEFNKSVIELLS